MPLECSLLFAFGAIRFARSVLLKERGVELFRNLRYVLTGFSASDLHGSFHVFVDTEIESHPTILCTHELANMRTRARESKEKINKPKNCLAHMRIGI